MAQRPNAGLVSQGHKDKSWGESLPSEEGESTDHFNGDYDTFLNSCSTHTFMVLLLFACMKGNRSSSVKNENREHEEEF